MILLRCVCDPTSPRTYIIIYRWDNTRENERACGLRVCQTNAQKPRRIKNRILMCVCVCVDEKMSGKSLDVARGIIEMYTKDTFGLVRARHVCTRRTVKILPPGWRGGRSLREGPVNAADVSSCRFK